MRRLTCYTLLFLFLVSCKDPVDPIPAGSIMTLKPGDIVCSSYIGNGAQWGGYDILNIWTGSASLSEADWEKLFTRVQFMRPPLVRIMVSAGWNYIINDTYDPSKSEAVLFKILDFCQEEGITVMFGEWGHQGGTAIDDDWLENATDFLSYLVKTKGYNCIKYYNMVNEPNGDWSTIDGNYSLWKNLIDSTFRKMTSKGIADAVQIIGPDIAIWDNNTTDWITNTNFDLGNKVGAYDIHTYPDQDEVRDGSYSDMTAAYKGAAPAAKVMLMTELGFKYASSSELGTENESREDADPYASDDSNMFIYDSFYGIDMADAIIQNMRAGYAGVLVWDMDDAMYNIDGSGSTQLKRWGFWNILGEEKFGAAEDENIRPWFYPVSLLCRYFPAGTSIMNINLPDKKGLRAVAGELNGKYTIALVNSNYVNYTIYMKSDDSIALNGMRKFSYVSGDGNSFTGSVDENGFALPEETNLSLDTGSDNGVALSVPALSFILLTNMD